jgi:response regulator RpfG family c-di-GMP phosphodiesterase
MTSNDDQKPILPTGEDLKALVSVSRLLFNLFKLVSRVRWEHSQDLAQMCEKLARKLGYGNEQTHAVYLGALFHDLGNLIPLDSDSGQQGHDKQYHAAELGEELLKGVECLEFVGPIIRHHSEHYDGSGQPDGLKGDEIPQASRLIGLVHAYLTMAGGYGDTPGMGEEEARQVIIEDAGIIYDPQMVQAFLELLPARGGHA